ncbi:hypothetical protein [Paenibacillus hexagrammi]|uniref:Uncharacterized protein n=1 Tax=Paenibacillus hexagrammi TaxID=2908839 RepID=A0ABY3SEM1_9BACL|nr:hypothetical protein [Paenibacillus sp. YPD9-1]UJF31636.1 hypothetical protein L0M14_17775 [Paenibacillus sp. YPD9-1]
MLNREDKQLEHRSKLSFAKGCLWSVLLSLIVWIPLIWWLIAKSKKSRRMTCSQQSAAEADKSFRDFLVYQDCSSGFLGGSGPRY